MAATIGADPEVFIRDTRTGGVIPAIGMLGGTKDEPAPLGKLKKGYAVQEDNVMAEFNIPPQRDAGGFAQAISRGIKELRTLVRTRGDHLDLDYASTRLFSHFMLTSEQAKQFGCSVDYDSYKQGAQHPRVQSHKLDIDDGAWRFAGGHIHLGYEPKEEIPPHVVAQLCDLFLGLPSVALDKQGPRRDLYGQAGRFRPTEYGIEYRTLSNFWVFDQNLSMQMGDKALKLCRALEGDLARLSAIYREVPWSDVQVAINTEDETLAADLLAYVVNDLTLQEAA